MLRPFGGDMERRSNDGPLRTTSAASDATFFAPAGRLPHDEIVAELKTSIDNPCVRVILEAVSGFVLIINEQRQVLAANQELLDAISQQDPSCIVGLRPGEVMNCVHFTSGPDGCGTAEHCRTCGAVLAILASQRTGEIAEDVCRLSMLRNGQLQALDLKARATPLQVGKSKLTAFVLHDISALKRREVLEQTFFHDFMNTIGGLEGWTRRLQESSDGEAAKEIVRLAERLKEEVTSHQTLLNAEQGTLQVTYEDVDVVAILDRMKLIFEQHPVTTGKKLVVTNSVAQITLRTDPSVLIRILANMLKNAFEATEPSGTVALSFDVKDDRPAFSVQNAAVMQESVKLRVFERSFSTSGDSGRGLGTYSMKLFGERFLEGTVSFSSNTGEGTTFRISLPQVTIVSRSSAEKKMVIACATDRKETDGHARILVVDDQESLLRLTETCLTRSGYDVVACQSGDEAMKHFMAAPESFTAVITDMRMPGMDGIELASRISQIAPVPIMLCTGLSDNMSEEEASRAGVTATLKKPFSLKELASSVALLLRRAA